MHTPYKSLVARAPDEVSVALQDWGNPVGPEILFIHGFSQASLSWARRTSSELAKEFRWPSRGYAGNDQGSDGRFRLKPAAINNNCSV